MATPIPLYTGARASSIHPSFASSTTVSLSHSRLNRNRYSRILEFRGFSSVNFFPSFFPSPLPLLFSFAIHSIRARVTESRRHYQCRGNLSPSTVDGNFEEQDAPIRRVRMKVYGWFRLAVLSLLFYIFLSFSSLRVESFFQLG